MRKHFFSSINYSSCNEDPSTELEALRISPGDVVACITGSGDRPLHMLLGDPAQVCAFDVNRVQNHLLELKIAAIRLLEYADYLMFLGVREDGGKQKRKQVYKALRKELSPGAARWFDANSGIIRRGVIYSGRWEKYFRLSSRCIRMWRGKKVEQLFSISDMDTQRAFVENHWDTRLWRIFLRLSFNPLLFKTLLRDPGFYTHIQPGFSPSAYIYRRMKSYLQNQLANESFMMALIFHGRFVSEKHYPAYLKERNYALLRERVDRVTIHNLSLEDLLESPLAVYCNKYSLSDVASFLDEKTFLKVLDLISQQPGCRFCLRDFLTKRVLPSGCTSPVTFYPELQEAMARKDRSIGYTFMIGETV